MASAKCYIFHSYYLGTSNKSSVSDKSEFEEQIASDSEAELEAPIGAAALRQGVE